MSRRSWLVAVTAALAVAFVVAAGLVAAGADNGLTRTSTVVSGVPLTTLRRPMSTIRGPEWWWRTGSLPRRRSSNGLADTLARNGYVVVLLDFSGHGASQRRLDLDQLDPSGDLLGADLDVAVRHLRAQPGVDARRTVLSRALDGRRRRRALLGCHPDDRGHRSDLAGGPHYCAWRRRSATQSAVASR